MDTWWLFQSGFSSCAREEGSGDGTGNGKETSGDVIGEGEGEGRKTEEKGRQKRRRVEKCWRELPRGRETRKWRVGKRDDELNVNCLLLSPAD